MRHRVYGRHLGRDKNQRTALFRGLLRSLIFSESIETTEAKAKSIKGLVDKLINAAKKKTPASLNIIKSSIPQIEVSKKLIEEIAPRFKKRSSGFTTMAKIGNRAGDGAMIVRMSLMDADKVEEEKVGKKEKTEKVKETKVKKEKI